MGISAIRFVQQGFDAAVLEATCEAVFDATACYFPVTFTPPPNDPHNISPDALKKGEPDTPVDFFPRSVLVLYLSESVTC